MDRDFLSDQVRTQLMSVRIRLKRVILAVNGFVCALESITALADVRSDKICSQENLTL